MLKKMKKFQKIIILSAFLIAIMSGVTAKTVLTQAAELSIDSNSAKSAYLIDADSGTCIYSKNENERLPIASMTKIMLLDLAFEAIENGELSLNEKITVSANASGMGGSQVFLEANKDYLVSDLIKSIVVASANDASVAIAERLFGSEQAAVDVMNQKASEIGLNDTLFSNCTGLMRPTQYSSAKDVAFMLKSLIRHDDYFKFSMIYLDEIEHDGGRKTTLTNTNKLIKQYVGCDGGKTGFTGEAGFCLAATAKRGAMRLIAVVIKENDGKTRFKDVCNMFDFGFANYTSKIVLDKNVPLEIKVKVMGGKQSYVEILPEKNFGVFGKKNQKDDIKIDFSPYGKINAPLKIGDRVGILTIYKSGIKIGEVDAVSACSVKEKLFFDYVFDIISAA